MNDVRSALFTFIGGLFLILVGRELWVFTKHWRSCFWNWLCGRGWKAL